MNQEFQRAGKVLINRDDKGVVRDLQHTDEPFVSSAPTPQLAAAEYLGQYGSLLGVEPTETANMSLARSPKATDSGDELRFASEKSTFDTTTVMYQQTRFGLPVWHGGVAIHMKGKPYRVIGSQSTRHADLDADRPSPAALRKLEKLDKATLARQLGLARKSGFDAKTLKIDDRKLIIYRYAQAKRVMAEPARSRQVYGHSHGYTELPLPAVKASIAEGSHYVSLEVHFTLGRRKEAPLNWVAILDAKTLSVLYLRAFVADVNGQVFLIDPVTTNGGPAANASSAVLNPVRTSVALAGLTASTPQTLAGSIVTLADPELPAVSAPTSTGDFNFDARTNQFAAVNAYYHCDRFFRLMQDLGFTLSGFFGSGTAFPSVVDHRGLGTAAIAERQYGQRALRRHERRPRHPADDVRAGRYHRHRTPDRHRVRLPRRAARARRPRRAVPARALAELRLQPQRRRQRGGDHVRPRVRRRPIVSSPSRGWTSAAVTTARQPPGMAGAATSPCTRSTPSSTAEATTTSRFSRPRCSASIGRSAATPPSCPRASSPRVSPST